MALEGGYVEIGGKKYQIVTIDFETYYDKTPDKPEYEPCDSPSPS